MKPQIIQQGAEAIIYKIDNKIIKDRIPKKYRLPEIDNKIRRIRTKSEAKILNRLRNIIHIPEILSKPYSDKIYMQYIDGKKISDFLETLDYKQISKQIGKTLTKLHNQNIIHGDLTTSNMIYVEDKNNIHNPQINKITQNKSKMNLKDYKMINNKLKNNSEINNKKKFKIYLIDFGLGFHSYKIEDKAVDLHLLQQALNAKHFKIADECFNIIIHNYKADNHNLIIKRIKVIESRGRYKGIKKKK